MGWYKDVQSILSQEPENWLAYLYGQQLENIPHLKRTEPRYRGILPQLAKFMLHLLRHLSLKRPTTTVSPLRYLVFVGTLNQDRALETVIKSLRQRGEAIAKVAPAHIINGHDMNRLCLPLTYHFADVCRAMFLLFHRGPALYKELKSGDPVAINWYFWVFCSTYVYLCYFHRTLTQLKPEFVIVSNDHNPANRCLLAVAHCIGIKTVYLQHASVSSLFPALRLNYAFLDGQCALDTYRECEKNQPDTERSVPLPKVLLTGQKKNLTNSENSESDDIGVALNALDDTEHAIALINALTESGREVRVRWHPAHKQRGIRLCFKAFSGHPRVSLSNPKTENISEFLSKIGWLVAGNSSVHLEAALAKVQPIYYEITVPDSTDYYGYVKHGLAKKAESPAAIIQITTAARHEYEPDVDAVRYYSSTYRTKWEGKEGDLVAECLSSLVIGKDCPVPSIALFERRFANCH